ncbi:FIP1[V]-like protein [Salvia miltiorrhiza]|uniref:FIP1[V]-like protein n=1 Tax=Salvia miltiorrhiza TaxID=226208 RepID=UPI0025AC2E88|nr:FIP1[V]-like protein [Salvia miltiorrhiza]
MEDDDEFGDLYTDVLRPLEAQFQPQREQHAPASAAGKAPPPQGRPIDLNIDSDDEEILYGASDSTTRKSNPPSGNSDALIREKTLPEPRGIDLNLDSNPGTARIDGLVGKGGDGSGFDARVLEKGRGLELRDKASGESSFMEDEDDINIIVEEREDKDGDLVENDASLTSKDEKMYATTVQEGNTMNLLNDAGEMGTQQMIPGLSGGLENPRPPNIEDEWESEESDDDLQIVLNDNHHGPMGMERMPGVIDDDDEDGEPLVIVADNGDVGHPHHQAQRNADEQEWGGEEGGSGADGEKDSGDIMKASGGGGGTAPAAAQPKIAYSNHAYHHPFSSQFKYVRPGAAPFPPAAPGAMPGQVRPPISMGPPAGRGRGDWRPAGMKGTLPQKGFHPPAWGVNSAGRGYGSGLDFTLPSHKTIFEVDIDSFEEKPWKLPGIDVSDFFNFGLNEDSWRDYCKQLEQLRLEMTMQSKIRVYESGRAEQDYDPDLPPELAAAVGIQDNNSSQKGSHGKVDAGPTDLARAAARERPSLPVGRPIPVETGSGDRLPSIDTRRPRMHDMDAIIEIACQSPMDGDDISEQQDSDTARKDHLGGGDEADSVQHDEVDHIDSYSPAFTGNKRNFESRRSQPKSAVNNDGIAREDVPHLPSENSHSDRETSVPRDERSTKGRRNIRSPVKSAHENKRGEHIAGDLKEESYRAGDAKQTPALSSSHSIGSDGEQDVAVADEMNDASVVDDKSFNMDREEMTSDAPNRGKREEGSLYSTKKQKLSSHVGLLPREYEDGKDSKAARSNDSKARSGSSEHLQSSPDDVNDEALQDRHPLRAGNIRREVGDEDNAHRKDHYDRDEAVRQNIVVKGREDSLSRRGGDANSSLHRHGKADNADWRKGSDVSEGTWNRRDDDHRGRRTRLEDPRKREHGREISSRDRDKLREKDKSEKDEHHQSRNQLDNGGWRGPNHEFDSIGSRQRDRDDHLKSRSERVDDIHSTRRKEETHVRRTNAEKDDISHSHRESSTRRKRERDDSSDLLKRDEQGRSKDDEVHFARQKEGGSSQRERSERQRERDEWHRTKQDDLLSKRERVETRPVMRSGRAAEDKTWPSHSRGNDDYKGSSREYHPKDIGRHTDQLKPRDRVENESFSQRRSHDDVYARGNQLNNDEKRTRYEKTSNRDDRAAYGSDTSRAHEYKRKEASRRSRDSDSGDHSSLIPSKRNQDEDGGRINEKASMRGRTEQQSGHGHANHQSSRKHKEEASTDEEQADSRRGRSKLERWTSHKERDFGITPAPSSSLKKRDRERERDRERDTHNSSGATGPPEDPSEKIEEDKPQPPVVDNKDGGPEMNSDNTKAVAVEDKHLDTVAKLKKRSERFKLPMPIDKDAVAVKKMESEPTLPSSQVETRPDSEIKSERPARKRRWTGN